MKNFKSCAKHTYEKTLQEPSAKSALPIADLAYAAGFFDGEGHIRIQQHSARCRTFMLQATATQATLFPLDWLQERFGGTVASRLQGYRGEQRAQYTWQISSAGAERFLRLILPYMLVKRDEAEIALQFRATFRPQFGDRSRMPESVLKERNDMRLQLQQLRKDKRRFAFEKAQEKYQSCYQL